MGLDLLDLVFRLQKCFGVRIIRAVAGSRLYDSAFDPPAVVKKEGGTRALQDRWGDQDDGSESWRDLRPVREPPSPLGPLLLSPHVARLSTQSDSCPTRRLSSDGTMVMCPPYLDPAYRPTRIVPGTGQAVLHSGGYGTDIRVSRAHFMLLGASRGILFVNGVPRRGGGIRPPLNGTRLVAPEGRALSPGEEYLIESGTAMVVRLPNRTELRIDAK